MSLEKKAKAIAKNIEGKVQEVIGEVTGDPQQKAEGKAKQVQAQAMNAVENLKGKAKNLIDKL
jgi:uncharacterized protein YjbJ (UPF0337 family)